MTDIDELKRLQSEPCPDFMRNPEHHLAWCHANNFENRLKTGAIAPDGSKPLPCPFCGSQPAIWGRKDESLWTHDIVSWWSVRCNDCDIEMEECEDMGIVLARWNRRA